MQPLFCIHPGGGFSWIYSRLIRHIPAGHPIYGLQARSLVKGERFPETIEDMAADYVHRIREIQPVGPYNLLGWSFGGLVAFAIATELRSLGQEVALLAVLDSYPRKQTDLLDGLVPHFAGAREGPIRNILDTLSLEGHLLARLEDHHYDAITEALRKSDDLMWKFVPQRFDGDILLFVSTDSGIESPSEAWRPYVDGEIKIFLIDSRHEAMMEPVPAAKIGGVLASALAQRTPDTNSNR